MSKTLSTTWSKMLRSIYMLPTKERLFFKSDNYLHTIVCPRMLNALTMR